MTERTQATPDLDTRLVDFDRKLREIQADLDPGHEPRPTRLGGPVQLAPEPEAASALKAAASAPDPAPEQPSGSARSGPLEDLLRHRAQAFSAAAGPQLGELGSALSSLRQAVAALEETLAKLSGTSGATAAEVGTREATVAAGPFETLADVRAFERELAAVPGVRDVTVRGYEGAARAIIDVEFGEDG